MPSWLIVPRFEYRIYETHSTQSNSDELIELFNRWGEEGWELKSVMADGLINEKYTFMKTTQTNQKLHHD